MAIGEGPVARLQDLYLKPGQRRRRQHGMSSPGIDHCRYRGQFSTVKVAHANCYAKGAQAIIARRGYRGREMAWPVWALRVTASVHSM